MTIQELFDKVYVINLNSRPLNHERMAAMLKQLGIRFQRMRGIDGSSMSAHAYMKQLGDRSHLRPASAPPLDSPKSMACTLSHINCIRDAQRRRYERILILEDDLWFHHNLVAELESKRLPEWVLLYLGASQFKWDVEEIDGGYLAKETYGRFAYGIHHSIYEEVIDTWMQWGTTGDGYLAHVIQPRYYGQCFVLQPNLMVADVSKSDIRGGRSQEEYADKFRWDMRLYI